MVIIINLGVGGTWWEDVLHFLRRPITPGVVVEIAKFIVVSTVLSSQFKLGTDIYVQVLTCLRQPYFLDPEQPVRLVM